MKATTPVKVSTPVQPVLPLVIEGSNEDLSDDFSLGSTESPIFFSPFAMEQHSDSPSEKTLPSTFTSTTSPTISEETTLSLCRRDYQSARLCRRAFGGYAPPYGAVGLFQHVAEIRTDLEWVERKAHSRQRHSRSLTWHEHEQQKKQTQRIPLVPYALILLCTALLLATFYVGDWQLERLSRNPSIGPSTETLLAMGALSTRQIMERGEWYRLVTATVLHGGFLHWLCNMIAIAYLGPVLEFVYGSLAVLIIFVGASTAANLTSAVLSPLSITVGASGGICALYGLALVDGMSHWRLLCALHSLGLDATSFPFGMILICIALEILLLIAIGLLPWIDNFGHLGGLFFGSCQSIVLLRPARSASLFQVASRPWFRCVQFKLKVTVLCFASALCAANVLWLHQSESVGDLPCRGCRYLDCPPLPMFQKFCDPCNSIREAYYQWSSPDQLHIELHCPYGDTVYFVTPELPTDRDGWMSVCHDHCDV
jgi:membrane associated rhomboid family serine protease